VTLSTGIVTREVILPINARHQRRIRLTKIRSAMMMNANAAIDEFDDALVCSLDSHVDSWVMDLGASFHTTPSKDLLSNYISRRFGKVYLADGKSLDIVRRGDIDIKTSNGSLWTLHNVRHIPALKGNLISIGQLDDEGLYTTFGDGVWKVTKGNLVVACGKKR